MTDEVVPESDLPEELVTPQAQSGDEVPESDMPESGVSGEAVPDNDLPDDEKYSSPIEQAKTVAEGVAKGVAGPLATGFETKVLGVDPKDIVGRQKANPWEAGLSEGAGNAAVFALTPEIGVAARLGKVGQAAIKGALEMGLVQGGDEVSKAMLGQGDPSDAVAAHIAGAAGLGLLTAGTFGVANAGIQKGLKAIENSKMGSRLTSAIIGMGHAMEFPAEKTVSLSSSALNEAERQGLHDGSFKAGQNFYQSLHGKSASYIARGAAMAAGMPHGATGVLEAAALEHLAEKVIGPQLTRGAQKYIAPTLLKAASSGSVNNISDFLNHATKISRGTKILNNAVNGIFESGEIQGVNRLSDESKDEKLKDFISDGGISQQMEQNPTEPIQAYAHGGEVKNMSPVGQNQMVAEHYPEQNVILSSAKARVSGLLQQARPIDNPSKLPFDTARPDPQKERDYKKLIGLANNPLSIVYKVRDGSLTPKQAQAFQQMYPELHTALSKKLTKKLAEDQLKDEKRPKHKVRQALSLFLGANLESSMTPQAALAAQMTFQMGKSQQEPQGENSKASLSKLGESAMTPEQARTKDLNKS